MKDRAAGEFDLIRHIARASGGHDVEGVVTGIGDDAAVLAIPRGVELVTAVDTLVAGVHFPHTTALADVGWKALAVNLSDLAAMAAEPRWALLALTVPDPGMARPIVRGLLECARRHGVALVGGDTTRGPLTVSVTLLGTVPRGRAVLRSGALPDDTIWIAGDVGGAAAGLAIAQGRLEAAPRERVRLLRALDRPRPPVDLGVSLRTIATSMIDISDGVLADLAHLLDASGLGATLSIASLPALPALRRAVPDALARYPLQTGGDDYTLLFTMPAKRRALLETAARQAKTRVSEVGRMHSERGLFERLKDGSRRPIEAHGFEHFMRG